MKLSLLGNKRTTVKKIKTVFGSSLIVLGTHNEPSGTVALDLSGNGRNGTYTGVTLGQTGIDGKKAGLYAATKGLNIYGASLAAAFNPLEGALFIVSKADLTAAGTQCLGTLFVNASNTIQLWKTAANVITAYYVAGGTSKTVAYNVGTDALKADPLTGAGWISYLLTWSKSGDRLKLYMNGVRVGNDASSLGTWAGALSATQTCIGTYRTDTFTFSWTGIIQYWALGNAALTKAQAESLTYHFVPSLVTFGDSITNGYGATTDYGTLIAAARGWSYRFVRAGTNGTTLQNTDQNTVATIGGATTNNGRDTYATRINTYRPEKVIILYGLNDIRLNDAAFTAANYQNDLGEIVDGLIANDTPASGIVIGSPPYMKVSAYGSSAPYDGATAQKFTDYRAAASAVATAKGTRYVDIYQIMADNGGDALMQADGIHANDTGQQVIANAFDPFL